MRKNKSKKLIIAGTQRDYLNWQVKKKRGKVSNRVQVFTLFTFEFDYFVSGTASGFSSSSSVILSPVLETLEVLKTGGINMVPKTGVEVSLRGN